MYFVINCFFRDINYVGSQHNGVNWKRHFNDDVENRDAWQYVGNQHSGEAWKRFISGLTEAEKRKVWEYVGSQHSTAGWKRSAATDLQILESRLVNDAEFNDILKRYLESMDMQKRKAWKYVGGPHGSSRGKRRINGGSISVNFRN